MDRVQRKRTKGSRLEGSTLCVTRGTLFGNPYQMPSKKTIYYTSGARFDVMNKFRLWIYADEQTVLRAKFILRCERDGIEHLACWCGLDQDCHADIWLEIWNNRKVES